ncbi:MAG TPA: GGDEF domain-containing protein [Anaerolineales bacterium]
MTKKAWIYIGSILLLGLTLGVSALIRLELNYQPWPTYAIIFMLAITTQFFKSEAPTHQLYHPSLMFAFAGVLLMPPAWYTLMVLVAHALEWIKETCVQGEHLRRWYLQPFNISSHLISGLAAGLVYRTVNPVPSDLTSLPAVAGALLGGLAYVFLNHLMVGGALVLARGVSWKESGILGVENLSTDFVMLILGFVIANLMAVNLWLVIPALTPLYLIYRGLAVPILQQQANTDSKTGLWNAEYFKRVLETELSRAIRFSRPLTIVMADLDFLRNINNAYGHLAGDAVLIEVAKLLKEFFRDYDLIARFGGEEFSILMPETTPEGAFARIEAVREAIARAEFEAPITHARFNATMSFGLAGLANDIWTVKEMIHCADVAVYQSKIQGRNRTNIYSADVALAMGIFDPEKADVDG